MTIEAAHYKEEIETLKSDPIIVTMEQQLPQGTDLESWDFVSAASDEYSKRGGTNAKSIGGPSRAIASIRKGDLMKKLTKDGVPYEILVSDLPKKGGISYKKIEVRYDLVPANKPFVSVICDNYGTVYPPVLENKYAYLGGESALMLADILTLAAKLSDGGNKWVT